MDPVLEPQRVGFQGAPGAYSEEAVIRACGPDAEAVPFRENRDVAGAVARREVDLGVLPVENTLAGSVPASYDAIISLPEIQVVGEVVLPIHHCVLGTRGASLDSLRSIESHPVALAQCGGFFAHHPRIEMRAAYDTAGAAAEVARAGDPSRGAIAGRMAATRYGLQILAANVEDRSDNQTRFVVVSPTPRQHADGEPARTILVLTSANRPGALLALLAPLAEHGLNMTKIESRPTGEPWTYRFIVEFEHRSGDPEVAKALAAMRVRAGSFHTLGTYPIEPATLPNR